MNINCIREAFDIFLKKENINLGLKKKFSKISTEDAIEISYELQSGSYVKTFNKEKKFLQKYSLNRAQIIESHLPKNYSLLKVGCGEITTLSCLLNSLVKKPKEIYAFDISLSRILVGKEFTKKNFNRIYKKLNLFVADMLSIPLANKSIDFCISNHSLESNGGRLEQILIEFFRVTKKKIFLFEPSYENNSIKGKQRMDKYGYIKEVEKTAIKLGAKIIGVKKLDFTADVNNPTYCYIIEPPLIKKKKDNHMSIKNIYTVPGTNEPVKKNKNYYMSNLGILFPVFEEIPVFKNKNLVLGSILRKK